MSADTENVSWDALAYVKASKRRLEVFEALAEQPQTAADLAAKLGCTRQTASQYISQLKGSTAIGEQHDLVECYTPERANHRIYGLTDTGEKVGEQLLD